MSHTLKVIAGGLVLLGLFLFGARWFIPVWLIVAAVNMWIGVTRAGYSVAEEAPIFLIVFAVPAGVAFLCAWALTR